MEDGKEREKGRKAPKKDLAGALELVETGGGGELQTHSVGSPAQRGAEGQQVPKRIELQAFASRQGDESDSSERDGKAGKENGPLGPRRHSHSRRAANMGAAEMMIPTLEASVYRSAVFSRRKYRVRPLTPAAAKGSSERKSCGRKGLGERQKSTAQAMRKRKVMISRGVKARRRILLEIRVVPQTTVTKRARMCPSTRLCGGDPIPHTSL